MIDYQLVLDGFANDILPDLVKVVFYTIIIPLIGMLGTYINKQIVSSHFGFIIKIIAQKIPKTLENWQEKRLSEAVILAKQHWYLNWMSESVIKNYIEVAVRTYRDSLEASNIDCEKKS